MKVALADLIDFIKQEYEVTPPSSSKGLHDEPWAACDIRTAMAPYLRFVAHSSERNPLKWSIERTGNTLSQ